MNLSIAVARAQGVSDAVNYETDYARGTKQPWTLSTVRGGSQKVDEGGKGQGIRKLRVSRGAWEGGSRRVGHDILVYKLRRAR